MSENKTLAVLLADRNNYEEVLEDAATYDTDVAKMWEDTAVAIEKKVDATYLFIKSIEQKMEMLKDEKKTIDSINRHAENEIKRIKERLHRLAQELNQGEALRGQRHAFHPFVSVTHEIDKEKEHLIEPNLTKYIVELDYKQFKELIKIFGEDTVKFKTKCTLSDLPEGHPAIKESIALSVRAR